jgi:shikimate kinase
MHHPEVTYLIGLPAAGKSSVGKALAKKNDYPFLDTDKLVEQASGLTVPELFAQFGQYAFRELERNVIKELSLLTTPAVIATGGGSPCYFDNLDVMLNHGTVIWVQAPLNEIAQRLISEIDSRPLLGQLEPHQVEKWLLDLLATRQWYYRRAHQFLTIENLVAYHVTLCN